jgi:hypothetical protein
MRLRTIIPIPALVAAIALVGAACADAPTGATPNGLAPNFDHKGKPHGKPNGDDGGKTVDVDFLESANGTVFDYQSVLQAVKGTNSKNRILVDGDPFTLSLAFPTADLGVCVAAPGNTSPSPPLTALADLQALSGAGGGLVGRLEITVHKRFVSNVVNFTVEIAADEFFFLTTGGGTNTVDESPTETTVTRTGGYVRINRNGDPNDSAICWGIVDYHFTVSK